jgi:hypothetical protein
MAASKFVFCAMLLPVESAISGKASNRKRPSHFLRSKQQIGASCVFRRTAQPSAMCSALWRARDRVRVSVRRTLLPVAQEWGQVPATPGDVEGTITASCPDKAFKFDDNCFRLCHCVSGADQMLMFADAPLSPNMRTQM